MGGEESSPTYKKPKGNYGYNSDLMTATPEQMQANYIDLKNTHYKQDSYKDPRYGEITVYKDKSNTHNQLILKKQWCNSKKDSNKLIKEIDNKRRNDNKTLAEMRGYSVDENAQCCSTSYEVNKMFEYYDRNLEVELAKKSKIPETDEFTKYFFEPEIWYIFDSLIMLEKSFNQKGYVHGDIQPYTMHIDPDGFVKVLDMNLVNPSHSAYRKVLNGKYKAALSPQQMESLRNGDETPHHNEQKSEVWAIGMTTLCASVNSKVNDYYDWSNKEIR